MISEDDLKECILLSKTNKSVKAMLEDYTIYVESPLVDSYLMAYDLIKSWRGELNDNKESVRLMSSEDKVFDRAFKVVDKLADMVDNLDRIRSKMTPEQIEDVEKKRSMNKIKDKLVL